MLKGQLPWQGVNQRRPRSRSRSRDVAKDPLHTFAVNEVASGPVECTQHLLEHGCLVVSGAVPAECCRHLASFVDKALLEVEHEIAISPDADSRSILELRHFVPSVRCPWHRRDFKLPLAPVVREAIECLAVALRGILERCVSREADLVELSCLVSGPGAARQPVHPDLDCSGTLRAPLLTAFVALQDILPEMGPSILCPGTHNQDAHAALGRELPEDRAGDIVVRRFGGVPVVCVSGTVVLMDSRLLHCGGANATVGGERRRLLYVTWQLPGNAASGSTYSIRGDLCGRLHLGDFLDSADAIADGSDVRGRARVLHKLAAAFGNTEAMLRLGLVP